MDEKEDEYRKRFKKAILRCGNVQREEEKITMYVDGLSTTTNTVAAQHRDNIHRCDLNFECLCSFNKSQEEAYLARLQQITFNFTNQERGRSLFKTHVG